MHNKKNTSLLVFELYNVELVHDDRIYETKQAWYLYQCRKSA